eukprot:scaffold66087_cov31-Tisochrysis_lutea.AAC.4
MVASSTGEAEGQRAKAEAFFTTLAAAMPPVAKRRTRLTVPKWPWPSIRSSSCCVQKSWSASGAAE